MYGVFLMFIYYVEFTITLYTPDLFLPNYERNMIFQNKILKISLFTNCFHKIQKENCVLDVNTRMKKKSCDITLCERTYMLKEYYYYNDILEKVFWSYSFKVVDKIYGIGENV